MTRQVFHVKHYWKVIVFYDLDFDLFYFVATELRKIGFNTKNIKRILEYFLDGTAKAVTCSNILYHTSIVLLPPHTSPQDYMDSIIHEAEHVKQAMLEAYKVEDRGEPPAYIIGYIARRMYPVIKNILFNYRYRL